MHPYSWRSCSAPWVSLCPLYCVCKEPQCLHLKSVLGQLVAPIGHKLTQEDGGLLTSARKMHQPTFKPFGICLGVVIFFGSVI